MSHVTTGAGARVPHNSLLHVMHMWMCHVTHINESCRTYEWVMSQQVLALECLITAYSMSALYLDGVSKGENQMMATGILLMFASIAFSCTYKRAQCLCKRAVYLYKRALNQMMVIGIVPIGASIAFSCTYSISLQKCPMSLQKSRISLQKSPTSNDGHRHFAHGCLYRLFLYVQTKSISLQKCPMSLQKSRISLQKIPKSNDGHGPSVSGCLHCLLLYLQESSISL